MNEYVSPFRLDHNAVTHFSLKHHLSHLPSNQVEVKIGADYSIGKIKVEGQEYQALVELKLLIEGKHEAKPVFLMELTMYGNFGGSSIILQEKEFVEMLEINGLTTLMQLSRAYITAVTALSGFGHPVNFPMINVLELVKKKKKTLTKSK